MLIKEKKWEIFEKINLWTNIIAIRNLVNERIIKDRKYKKRKETI